MKNKTFQIILYGRIIALRGCILIALFTPNLLFAVHGLTIAEGKVNVHVVKSLISEEISQDSLVFENLDKNKKLVISEGQLVMIQVNNGRRLKGNVRRIGKNSIVVTNEEVNYNIAYKDIESIRGYTDDPVRIILGNIILLMTIPFVVLSIIMLISFLVNVVNYGFDDDDAHIAFITLVPAGFIAYGLGKVSSILFGRKAKLKKNWSRKIQ